MPNGEGMESAKMKTNLVVLFTFLISLFWNAAYADVKESEQDIKSIQKIARNLKKSLAMTWEERQKAVNRGYEKKFDSAFIEAQRLVDNLFVEIHNFIEMQNATQVSKEKSNNLKTVSSEKLNQDVLKVIAQFQVLMEHLQNTLQEVKTLSGDGLALYPYQTSNRITATSGPSNKKRRMRTMKSKRLKESDDTVFGGPSIRYQISGAQIDMPDPMDESFIH